MSLHIQPYRYKSGRFENAVFVVFALGFAAIGCVALIIAVILLFEGSYRDMAFAAPFAVAFGGIGINMLIGFFSARATAGQLARARLQHPDSPWLWRQSWTGGRIKSRSKIWLKFVWYFAFLWNSVSFPIGMMIPKALAKGGGEVVLLCLFPAVGLGLLAWAVERTIHWRKFGRSVLVLDTFPGIIGGELRGVVETGFELAPAGDIRIDLRCLRVLSYSDTTGEEILWHWERDLPPGSKRIRPEGLGIPIKITIPYESSPSSPEDSDDQVAWRLKVQTALKGLDYAAGFDVPVFFTPDSSEFVTAQSRAAPHYAYADHDGYRFTENSAIKLEKKGDGGIQINYPSNTTPMMKLWPALTAVAAAGFAWALVFTDAPLFFPLMFGAFSLLFMFGAISFAFRKTMVRVKQGSITIINRTLGMGTTRELSDDQVADIHSAVHLDTPKSTFYEIKVRKYKGWPVTAGTMIPSKREAEWIVGEIRSAFAGR